MMLIRPHVLRHLISVLHCLLRFVCPNMKSKYDNLIKLNFLRIFKPNIKQSWTRCWTFVRSFNYHSHRETVLKLSFVIYLIFKNHTPYTYSSIILHCRLLRSMPNLVTTEIMRAHHENMPQTPLLYSKTGVYRGIHYFSYFC